MVEGTLMFVVYTEQEINDQLVVKLISARGATKSERKRYEKE
jgi:uncharacterized DUF497 family protein